MNHRDYFDMVAQRERALRGQGPAATEICAHCGHSVELTPRNGKLRTHYDVHNHPERRVKCWGSGKKP